MDSTLYSQIQNLDSYKWIEEHGYQNTTGPSKIKLGSLEFSTPSLSYKFTVTGKSGNVQRVSAQYYPPYGPSKKLTGYLGGSITKEKLGELVTIADYDKALKIIVQNIDERDNRSMKKINKDKHQAIKIVFKSTCENLDSVAGRMKL
jgi:hypothetical protein